MFALAVASRHLVLLLAEAHLVKVVVIGYQKEIGKMGLLVVLRI